MKVKVTVQIIGEVKPSAIVELEIPEQPEASGGGRWKWVGALPWKTVKLNRDYRLKLAIMTMMGRRGKENSE
jgi:hypothetical protein